MDLKPQKQNWSELEIVLIITEEKKKHYKLLRNKTAHHARCVIESDYHQYDLCLFGHHRRKNLKIKIFIKSKIFIVSL